MKKLQFKALGILFILNLACITGIAQTKREIRDKAKTLEIQKLIASKHFTFKAQIARPMRGGNINLTSDYELIVKKDTLDSYLPYFGRAFTAPINPTDAGLTFTSTDFEYDLKNGKKGSKEITIVPKNKAAYARNMYLSVSPLGYATLQIVSNNREPISYSGYISSIKK